MYSKGKEFERVYSSERLGNAPQAALFEGVTAVLSKDNVPQSMEKMFWGLATMSDYDIPFQPKMQVIKLRHLP